MSSFDADFDESSFDADFDENIIFWGSFFLKVIILFSFTFLVFRDLLEINCAEFFNTTRTQKFTIFVVTFFTPEKHLF